MQPAHRRHDISDRVWKLLEPHLEGRKGIRGVTARDNRLFINAVFGFYARAHPGDISRRTMAIGKTHIVVFAAGETEVIGRCSLRFLWPNRILSG